MILRETDGRFIQEYEPVTFIDKMGDDYAVCNAARVSFDKEAGSYTPEANQKLLHYLANHDHWSPFAHVHFKFKFRAPIFIARQFVKHQVGFAWNEVSRRYVSEDPMFWIPDAWRKRPSNIKQGSTEENAVEVKEDLLTEYVNQMYEHAQDYRLMIKQGVCPEQVRAIMPQAMMTEWIWTGSLQAWWRFFELRSDKHAQAECWPYADAVQTEILKHFPMSWKALQGTD
tara:strand:+ start:140 stop:823 length:684 start_codon:yes stop_codon:yes gene_type:complete